MGVELNGTAMEYEFYEDSMLIGIVCSEPAYRLCWLINKYFGYNFICEPEMTSVLVVEDTSARKTTKGKKAVELLPKPEDAGTKKKNATKKKELTYHMPVFQFQLPNSNFRHLLYKLKAEAIVESPDLFTEQTVENPSLLPEFMEFDYMWYIKTGSYESDAEKIQAKVLNIQQVKLAEIIEPLQLVNPENLLV